MNENIQGKAWPQLVPEAQSGYRNGDRVLRVFRPAAVGHHVRHLRNWQVAGPAEVYAEFNRMIENGEMNMDIENGMVLMGGPEWERLNAPVPSDTATGDDYGRFAWDTGRVAEMLIAAFGLSDGDMDEEVAKAIYSGLPARYAEDLANDWAESDRVQEAYNEWVHEGRKC